MTQKNNKKVEENNKKEEGWETVGATAWNPNPEESLIGRYTGREVKGDDYTLHTFETDKQKFTNIWGTKILNDKLNTIKPAGQELKIVYRGLVEPENKRAYHLWDVYKRPSDCQL